jgi:3-methyladenine DNA glycosylase AlkC
VSSNETKYKQHATYSNCPKGYSNHLSDIAKDHPEKVFEICDRWLNAATPEIKWLIRHALRHPAKKGDKVALQLRAAAK